MNQHKFLSRKRSKAKVKHAVPIQRPQSEDQRRDWDSQATRHFATDIARWEAKAKKEAEVTS